MRRAAAILLGVLAGMSPAADSGRTAFESLAAVLSIVHAPAPGNRPVTIVALDAAADAHPLLAGLPSTAWPRQIAPVIDHLLDAGAAVIGFDVVWPLAGADAGEWLAVLRRGARDGRIVLGYLHDGERTITPHPAQVAAVGGDANLRALNVPIDGGRVRTAQAWLGDPPRPTMALELAARYQRTDPHALAQSSGNPLLAPWYVADVGVISLAELLDCEDPAAVARGRMVLFGAWRSHVDRHPSVWRLQPASARRMMRLRCDGTGYSESIDDPVPGVLLHAVAGIAFTDDVRIRRLPATVEAGVFAAAAGAASRLRAAVACLLAMGTFAIACWALLHGWLVPWAGASIAAGTVLALRAGCVVQRRLHAWAAGLPSAFRDDPSRAASVDATVCFIDIANWTRRGESADTRSLADDLGTCLGRMSELIAVHGGHVDKYLGDGLMAVFGLGGGDDHPGHALAATQACFAECTRMRIAGEPVRLRAGLARGMVRVGDLGRDGRMHFTAIGDPVNVAARLEQLNRTLGTFILADEGVMTASPDAGWRDCGMHTLRGRGGALGVWALVQQ